MDELILLYALILSSYTYIQPIEGIDTLTMAQSTWNSIFVQYIDLP